MKINSENNNSAVLSELGARIKRNRIDMQLSQQDFAAKAGISTRTLSGGRERRGYPAQQSAQDPPYTELS